MGLFLSISSVVGADHAAVAASLRSFIEARGGTFREDPSSEREDRTAFIAPSARGASVLYPEYFDRWDEAAAHLSSELAKPVFSFHVHDGEYWMFILFVNGEPAVQFCPLPDYWDESIGDDEAEWLPSGEEVAAHVPGVDATVIGPYLRAWMEEGADEEKAHADDAFTFGDAWQLTDFMGRLGFAYPEPDAADAVRYYVKAGRGR